MPSLDSFLPILLTLSAGAVTAVQVALGAALMATLLGLLMALVVCFVRSIVVQTLLAAYVEWMRNVPALAHLFLLYFGLASVGVNLSPRVAAIVGLGLVGAAVLCDVFAAGIKALHVGQREAALAVGLTPIQTLQCIVLPQMVRSTLPSLGNYASQLVKDTSVASAIAAPEIMFYARNLVTSTFETPLIYATAILIYAAMVYPVSGLFSMLERWLGRHR